MPQFYYKGTHASGHEVSGTIEAASQFDALQKLAASQVIPSELRGEEETGAVRPRNWNRTFGFLFFAFACLAGGGIFALLMPIDLIRCTPDRSCTIEHRVAGLYVLDKEQATDLTTADTGSEQTSNATTSGFGGGRQPRPQGTVVLSGKGGEAYTFPKQHPVPSDDFVRNSVQKFLSAPNGKSYTMLQGELGFVVVIVLFLAAIHLFRLAMRR